MVGGDEARAVQNRGRPDGSDPPGRDKYVVETDLSGAVVTGKGVQLCVAAGLLIEVGRSESPPEQELSDSLSQ